LRQDADLRRQQTSTIFDHAVGAANDLSGGRFGATGSPNVTGATPIPRYEGAPRAHDPVPQEPPLGFDNPALEDPAGVFPPVSPPADTGPAEVPDQSPDLFEHAAAEKPGYSPGLSARRWR
jgi:hypothetical protein